MGTRILSIEEISKLTEVLRKVFSFFDSLRKDEHLASLIQDPKIPSEFSESIAYHLLATGVLFGKQINVSQSTSGGDLVFVAPETGINQKLEVKATGASAWQQLSNKDITSDFLMWIHFGNCFRSNNDSKIIVCLMIEPKNCISSPLKLNLNKFIKLGEGRIYYKEIDVNDPFNVQVS